MGADIVWRRPSSACLSFGGPTRSVRDASKLSADAGRCARNRGQEGRAGSATLSDASRYPREKATSNLHQSGLCVLAFTIHIRSCEAGLRRLAPSTTPMLWHCQALGGQGGRFSNDTFFNEFTFVTGDAAECRELTAKACSRRAVSRLEPGKPELADLIVVASTEVNTDEDRAAYAKALKEVL